jgi:hypothetical protein
MASLRNLDIGILRAYGHRNIAAALRRDARDATRLLPSLPHNQQTDTPALYRGPAGIPGRTAQSSLLTIPRQSACISPPIA